MYNATIDFVGPNHQDASVHCYTSPFAGFDVRPEAFLSGHSFPSVCDTFNSSPTQNHELFLF